jgi:hypothetical protein
MRAPLSTCSWRSAVAVLASGAVISLSALSGGVAPAFAKPDKNDPGIPVVPTPEVVVPEAPPQVREQAPADPPPAPKQAPSPPQVEAPPQQTWRPAVQAPAPAPEVSAPPKVEAPRVVDPPKFDAPRADPPKADAPKAETPKVDAPMADPPKANVPQVDAPKVDTPKAVVPQQDLPRPEAPKAEAPNIEAPKAEAPNIDAPKADAPNIDAPKAGAPASLPGVDQPTKPGDPGQTSRRDAGVPDQKQADTPAAKAGQRVTMAAPDTLQAPTQDIELARQARPIEVKPEPAKKDDVDFLSSALNVSSKTKLGPFESEFSVGSQFSVGDRDRDRNWDRDRDHDWDWDNKHWDHRVRQWDRRWIEYDDFYRPMIFNPFRAPVRIVYIYDRAPRIVYVPPLGRVLVDAAALGAYSFTAAVLNTANLAADVAVGTFFGGGYLPPIGAPFVPPPPLLRYDNVPVQVRYSNATYQPFRVNQIVDLGDDVQYGGRKVLLDGATPAWGQWTQSPTGERQFEVNRTQQYPGLGEPQEAPLPGDYRMQLASDQSADHTQMYLMAAAGVIAGLGFAALGVAVYLGRRRPQM